MQSKISLPWSDREIFLLQKLTKVFNVQQIVEAFRRLGYNRGYDSIEKKRRVLIHIERESPDFEPFTEEEDKIIQEIASTTATFVTKDPGNILETLKKLSTEVHATNPKKAQIRNNKDEKLILCISDVHYGARVEDALTGEEIYDQDIALKNLSKIPDLISEIIANRKFGGIYILLLGDIVDGEDIYPSHNTHVDIPVLDQTRDLIRVIWQMAKTLRKILPEVHIECVPGNHGRMSKSAHERSNWDNVIYQQLALLAEIGNDSGITVEYSRSQCLNFKVNGWTGHLRHEAIAHDGTAAAKQKLGGWFSTYNYDFLVCGHFHNPGVLNYNGRPIFRNGSMMPSNDLADRIAADDIPRQIIFGISEKKLPTFVSFLTF
jgi:UDP-2,3-diacylglucosamine pyrophosphatase LpxH